MAKAGIYLAALTAMLGSVASAEGPLAFKVISPIFGQLVTFSMPQAFVVIGENTNGPSYIREAVLKGETASRWTQMITVTGAKGLVANPKLTPETFAASIAGGFKSACPDTFTAKGVGPAKFGDAMSRWQAAAASSPLPTSTAKPRWSSPLKATPITTRCNGPNARRPPASLPSTRRNGWSGCASCSRSGSVRSCPARPRPIRAALARASARASRGVSKS
jgi:hypothetical protein